MLGTTRDLLIDIEAFLTECGVSATKFGLAAVNDGHLIKNLRSGASVTLKTADKVRAYMAQQRSAAPAGDFAREAIPARRVLLIIGGGIAAYKCLDLIRRLRERGIAVRAVMTGRRRSSSRRFPSARSRATASSPNCSISTTSARSATSACRARRT